MESAFVEDEHCARCEKAIPPWVTAVRTKGGTIYCSESCQRLQEQIGTDPADSVVVRLLAGGGS